MPLLKTFNVFSHFTALSTPFGVYCVQTGEQVTVMNEYWGVWWAIAERRRNGNFVRIWLADKEWSGYLPHGSSITIQGGDWKFWTKPFYRLNERSMKLWNYLNGYGPKPVPTKINPTAIS